MNVIPRFTLLLSLALAWTGVPAQQRFQTATIKPSAPDTEKHTRIFGNSFATSGTTVEDLLKFAYNIHSSQLIGGPDWIKTTQFDIFGDPEMERRPSLEELKAMTADLLADRFHLVLRKETRKLAVYGLLTSKRGFRLKPLGSDPSSIVSGTLVPPGNLYVHGGTIGDFVIYLQRFAPPELDRPIVDRTGIAGRYEFELHYTPDVFRTVEETVSPSSNPASPEGIFTAMQDQLGLRLQATSAWVEMLDVASIAPPSPN